MLVMELNKLYYEEDLPSKIINGKTVVNWANSIGKTVRFDYNGVHDILTIVDYNYKNHRVVIKYKDVLYDSSREGLKGCRLRNLFSKIFLYEIGDVVNNLKLTDRFIGLQYKQTQKLYKYTCLKCKWDGGEINEIDLKRGTGCSCCAGRITIPGINDIPTTAPWMVKYFQRGYDEAKLYTCQSNKKINPICPDCGRIKDKQMTINNIYKKQRIGCNCSKTTSYPNKFIFKMLDQLQIQFETEKVFDWAKFAIYDFYFVSPINNKEYIIEADGSLGHGNYTFERTDFSKIESLYYDFRKDMIAEKHGIPVIRIDCKESSLNYIKNNVLYSELKDIINLNKVNWELCSEYALKNIVKEVCILYANGKNVREICDTYNHLSTNAIRNYLHRGTEIGWCNYDGKQSLMNTIRENGKKNAKEIIVFDSSKQYLHTWCGIGDFVKNSLNIIKIKTDHNGITRACKTGNKYKGFYFKYKSDVPEEDYLEMINFN